jgi:hypothetical protein
MCFFSSVRIPYSGGHWLRLICASPHARNGVHGCPCMCVSRPVLHCRCRFSPFLRSHSSSPFLRSHSSSIGPNTPLVHFSCVATGSRTRDYCFCSLCIQVYHAQEIFNRDSKECCRVWAAIECSTHILQKNCNRIILIIHIKDLGRKRPWCP